LSWTEQEAAVEKDVEESLKDEKVDAILCVAGGWAGGNAANKGMRSLKIMLCFDRYLPHMIYCLDM
jgi:hypothetical protein